MRFLDHRQLGVAPATAGSSAIAVDGHSGRVEGVVLEAAVVLEAEDPIQGWLFFMTDDVPYEDMLTITLTDAGLRPLDRARIGAPYVTGTFRAPRIDGPGRLSFDFIDERRWHLAVLARPTLALPFVGDPRGVHRPLRLHRHFTLDTSG
ncbi:hypothetical protein [Zavarzinia sp.]|uniref:hypothetical protein n=1 Tax=Zavarzinia sp. TaxID=2027920 RepID=UPI0035646596